MTTPTLSKVSHPQVTLRDIVQDKMRDAIIDGYFLPGARLVERPLCEQLGVSRTVVRETIRYLEAEGMVEILPGQGPIVAPLSWADAKQIYDIRRMLETAAAQTCAQNLTPEVEAGLNAAFDGLATASTGQEPSTLHKATNAFYSQIFKGAGHDIALEVVTRLNGRIGRLRMLTLSHTERVRPGIEHMRLIRDAILSGDAAQAAKAVTQHIDDTTNIARQLLAENQPEA